MKEMLSCMIVDDEPLAVKLLESFVVRTPELQLLGSFTDSVEAIGAVKGETPDLLFLDIQMPDMNGMELARMLPVGTRVIFTTAFREYAFESYEVNALDFLLKPIRYNKFIAAVEKAREWFGRETGDRRQESGDRRQESGDRRQETGDRSRESGDRSRETGDRRQETLFIKVDGEYRQISLADILYVAGMKDYVMFYLSDDRRPLVTHLTMKAVEDMLPRQRFMRVHRSYIVALNKICKVDRNDCIYIGEEIIHVTDAFLDRFTQYLNSKFPGGR